MGNKDILFPSIQNGPGASLDNLSRRRQVAEARFQKVKSSVENLQGDDSVKPPPTEAAFESIQGALTALGKRVEAVEVGSRVASQEHVAALSERLQLTNARLQKLADSLDATSGTEPQVRGGSAVSQKAAGDVIEIGERLLATESRLQKIAETLETASPRSGMEAHRDVAAISDKLQVAEARLQ